LILLLTPVHADITSPQGGQKADIAFLY